MTIPLIAVHSIQYMPLHQYIYIYIYGNHGDNKLHI